MYNKHSLKATEFIDDEEIKETLRLSLIHISITKELALLI